MVAAAVVDMAVVVAEVDMEEEGVAAAEATWVVAVAVTVAATAEVAMEEAVAVAADMVVAEEVAEDGTDDSISQGKAAGLSLSPLRAPTFEMACLVLFPV